MSETRDQIITHAVRLDGATFVNCAFKGARLLYAGGRMPLFENCTFEEASFVFEGPANETVTFLRSLSPKATNMRAVVYGLIPELQEQDPRDGLYS